MAQDNELLVLIYETMQKQLSQMKDSRVVVQQLCNRVGVMEQTCAEMDKRTADICERLSAAEEAVKGLTDTAQARMTELNHSNIALADTVDALRDTVDTVTNPSIIKVSETHRDTKDAVRDLVNVHNRVMDEFEHYELRLVRLEDTIAKMLTNRIRPAAESKEQEDSE